MGRVDKILMNATTIDRFGKQQQKQAIAISNGYIVFSGPEKALTYFSDDCEDCQGQLVTPGLIDCHTHLVYAGNRADEFQKRLLGATYSEIALAGGGILSTVRQTRSASEEELIHASLPRLLALRSEGVLTVEIKSGYGLDLNNEIKMLRVARRLGEITGVRVLTTFLGAHAVAPEFAGRNQAYVDYLCHDVLPAVSAEGLADAVDVFCESIGFSLAQTEQLFKTAQTLGLPIKCHAEQLSNLGASKLAAQYSALSSDHLEYLDEMGVEAMAKANTVAVLLPGAYYFLKEVKTPPIEMLRKASVGMAIATDCNPGSSPTTSLLLMMNMACQLFGLTVSEVLAGVTYQAARALGLADKIGAVEAGKVADIVRWSVKDSADLCYHFGCPLAHETMIAGLWSSK